MRVLVMPADLGGCGHYRLLMAAEHLRSLGYDIHIKLPGESDNGFEAHLDENDNIVDFRLPVEDVDVIVMQRVSHDMHRQAIPLLRKKGVAVVVDMDDDLSTIHPKNVAFWNYRTHSLTPFSAKNAQFICNEATLVTVSTRPLLRVYAKHGRGQIIDNYVPERYLYMSPIRDDDAPVFGWAGTMQSHPTDVQVVGRSVRDLVREGHQFRVVGPADPRLKVGFKLDEDAPATGVVSLFNWPTSIANLDVGLAPLEPSTFNTSKSRLKVLEYNSVGIPYVASPRDEYRRYHRESRGSGILAETPKDWATAIRRLMKDETMRKELGEQGRAHVYSQTIEMNSWRWLEAWDRAFKIQRGLV